MPRECSQFNILWFLELYKQYPCLWDKNFSDYKDRRKRDQAESELLHKTGFENVKILRMKIRSIRGTYNNELRKIKIKNKSGIEYQPKLQWFEYADSFLNKNYENDCELSTRWTASNEIDTKNWQEQQLNNQEKNVDIPTLEPAPSTSKNATESTSVSTESDSNVRANETQIELDAVSNLQVTNTKIFNHNEFALFGLTVGLQLSKLPLRKALELQQNIQSLITTARIIELESSLNIFSKTNIGHN